MSSTTTEVIRETVKRNDIVRFVPLTKRNRVMVMVDAITTVGSLTMVHGVRCTAEGCIDSQAQRHAWPATDDTEFEVVV